MRSRREDLYHIIKVPQSSGLDCPFFILVYLLLQTAPALVVRRSCKTCSRSKLSLNLFVFFFLLDPLSMYVQ
jgi:hypothetical protein